MFVASCVAVFLLNNGLFSYSIGIPRYCGGENSKIVGYEGQTVRLSCFTHLAEIIQWSRKSPAKGYEPIFSTGGLQNGFITSRRFNVTDGTINGFYNLTITNLQLNDTAIYTCNENGGLTRTPTNEFQLTVLGKDPVYGGPKTRTRAC